MGKATSKPKTKSKLPPPGAPGVVTRQKEVGDPYITPSDYYSRLKARPHDPDRVGKVVVLENAMSRIGALCYIDQRSAVQEKAAEHFKALYEVLYGGQPSMDLSNPVVDNTVVAHDSGMAQRVDRVGDMRLALETLGRTAFNRIVASVCMGISFRDYHWRKKKLEVQALLRSLDDLAEAWDLKSEEAAE